MSKIIAIVNQKGGVAKTTTSNALGIGLAEKGYKVLLVDLDPQGNLSMSLGVSFPDEEEQSIAKLLVDKLQGKDITITAEFIHSNYGVDFLVGNDDLGSLERMMSGFRDKEFVLSEVLKDVSLMYDYIIIDCMPSIGNLTENAIIAADQIIIPSEPQFFSVKGIQSLYNEISRIQKRNNPNLTIAGILATKVDMRTNIAKAFVAQIENVFTDKVSIFNAMIPISTRLAECNVGHNLFEYDKNGKGVLAYKKFIDEYLMGE